MNRPKQYKRPNADEWNKLAAQQCPNSGKPPKQREPRPPTKRPKPETLLTTRKHPWRTTAAIAISAIVIFALWHVVAALVAPMPTLSNNPAGLPAGYSNSETRTHPTVIPSPTPYHYQEAVSAIINPATAPPSTGTATPAPSIPTPTNVPWETIYIEAFASCGGTYDGEEKSKRREAARTTIERGYRTLDELRAAVDENCPGAISTIIQQTQQEVIQRVVAKPNTESADSAIEAFASCNGMFDENARAERRRAAQSALEQGYKTLAQLKARTAAICPGASAEPMLNEFAQAPDEVQKAFEDGTLQPLQEYELAACHINPHHDSQDRALLLFSDETEPIDGPVFAVHFQDGPPLQHGGCYKIVATYMGSIEWRMCQSQPYDTNCNPNSEDFLWEKEIPAFQSSPGVMHLWWAY